MGHHCGAADTGRPQRPVVLGGRTNDLLDQQPPGYLVGNCCCAAKTAEFRVR